MILSTGQLSASLRVAAVVVPVAVYFLVLGLLNSRRHPQLLRARRDFLLLIAALCPLFVLPVLEWSAGSWAAPAVLAAAAGGAGGCDGSSPRGAFDMALLTGSAGGPGPAAQRVPEPIDLLLPKEIRIHPFTGTRTFDRSGGVKGVDVRIEAIDAFGDATKAFGNFRFALYRYRSTGDHKGRRIATWVESLLEPEKNLLHWDSIARAYKFKLQWYHPIAVGTKVVLTATFSSPFTERKFAERTFLSGQ